MNGTAIKDMVIDDRESGLFRVNRRSFIDPDILELERREIFDRSWLYVGHESEIAKPGDFVTRKVGGRPIILVRDIGGEVRVLMNSCAHRGNLVCREKSGNARAFTCFYHAWTYGTNGMLRSLPGEDAYTPAFDKSELGLKSAPRVESYRGLVFLSYDADIVDLATYLGNAAEHLDMMLDFSGDDLEIVQGGQSYCMRANWKLLVENSIDSYHAMPTHQRYFGKFLRDMGIDNSRWAAGGATRASHGYALDNGHSLIESYAGSLPISAAAGEQLQEIRRKLDDRFGKERARKIGDFSRNLFIFPNLIFVANWRTVRTFYPIAPDYMEIEAWALLPRGESQELRELRLNNFISFLGPAGFGTPDDVEALEGCQHGFATAREHAWSDISRGMGREEPMSSDELQMRSFWRRWRALLSGDRGKTNTSDRSGSRIAAAE
jgi:phenylpropionate dioxygenase-like ring-hydroxylating dioxygenase large terminal subunit